jgi:hypothetical protein
MEEKYEGPIRLVESSLKDMHGKPVNVGHC